MIRKMHTASQFSTICCLQLLMLFVSCNSLHAINYSREPFQHAEHINWFTMWLMSIDQWYKLHVTVMICHQECDYIWFYAFQVLWSTKATSLLVLQRRNKKPGTPSKRIQPVQYSKNSEETPRKETQRRAGKMISVGKTKQYANVLDKLLSRGRQEVHFLPISKPLQIFVSGSSLSKA